MTTAREKLSNEILVELGNGMIDVELDPIHLNLSIDRAFQRYRQRSENSVEESHCYMEIQPHQTVYVLPQEIVEVINVYRRGTGNGSISPGKDFDPFSLAASNAYLLQVATGGSMGGGIGPMAMYETYSQYMRMNAKLFGQKLGFTWNHPERKLTIFRNFFNTELILLWVYNYRQDETLLNDTYAGPWLRSYAKAQAMLMLGEARSKYGSVLGPSGQVTLNGNEMIQRATVELERLETEVKRQVDQRIGYTWTTG